MRMREISDSWWAYCATLLGTFLVMHAIQAAYFKDKIQ